MKHLWRQHPRLVLAFALALTLTLLFAGRITVSAIYWSANRYQQVQPWMTVGYIGKSWGLDPREIDLVAGLPPPQGQPLTLVEIARQRGVPVSEVIAEVEAALAALSDAEPQR